MTRELMIAFVSALLVTGCGSRRCPVEHLPEYPVESGEYRPTTPMSGELNIFNQGSDHRLTIDREAGTAHLSFTTSDGREIELQYTVSEDGWRDNP